MPWWHDTACRRRERSWKWNGCVEWPGGYYSRELTDAPNASNSAETAGMGHDDGANTYLGGGGAGCGGGGAEVTNGSESYVDVSSGHSDVPSVEIDGIWLQTHRTRRKKKPLNLLIEAVAR